MASVFGRRSNLVAGIILLMLASGCKTINLTPNIRDEGPIVMGGNDPTIHFVVSHNVDDDNNDTVPDKAAAVPDPTEDNLRALTFVFPGADTAVLAPPQFNDATGRMANNVLVRAWKDDRTTPFPFNAPQPLPLTVYFEGISNIGSLDQFLFEYGYLDNAGAIIGQGLAYGTVVDVETETWMRRNRDTTLMEQSKRLLIRAGARSKATVTPANGLRVRWRHATLTIANAGAVETALTAGNAVSPAPADPLSVTVNLAGQEGDIIAEGPLAVVGPDAVQVVGWTFPRPWRRGRAGTATAAANNLTATWLSVNHLIPVNVQNARRNSWDLFDGRVRYRVVDQFDNPIIEAPFDRARIMVREDVPLVSRVPNNPQTINDLAAALAQLVQNNTTPNWKRVRNGVFPDHLNIFISPGTIMTAQPLAVVIPAAQDFITMATHDWHVSVEKGGANHRPRTVTNNTLAVEVDALLPAAAPVRLRTEAEYTIVLP